MPKKKSPTTINNSRPPTDSRPLRRLPPSWKKPAHPPSSIPQNYPRLLDLPAVRPLVEAAAVDGVLNDIALLSVSSSRSSSPSPPSPPPPRTPTPLAIALRSPAVTKLCVPRSTNAHLLLAQRGDAILRSLLLEIGEEIGLTLSGRHHLVAQVGSNATLAQICLETGVLDAAIATGTRRVKVDNEHLTAAAGIFEAVAAALHDELGFAAEEALKIAVYPWVVAVVVQKVVPYVVGREGAKAGMAVRKRAEEMMVDVLGAAKVSDGPGTSL